MVPARSLCRGSLGVGAIEGMTWVDMQEHSKFLRDPAADFYPAPSSPLSFRQGSPVIRLHFR